MHTIYVRIMLIFNDWFYSLLKIVNISIIKTKRYFVQLCNIATPNFPTHIPIVDPAKLCFITALALQRAIIYVSSSSRSFNKAETLCNDVKSLWCGAHIWRGQQSRSFVQVHLSRISNNKCIARVTFTTCEQFALSSWPLCVHHRVVTLYYTATRMNVTLSNSQKRPRRSTGWGCTCSSAAVHLMVSFALNQHNREVYARLLYEPKPAALHLHTAHTMTSESRVAFPMLKRTIGISHSHTAKAASPNEEDEYMSWPPRKTELNKIGRCGRCGMTCCNFGVGIHVTTTIFAVH